MTAQTIMATDRHVKQVAAASRSLASPSAIEAKVASFPQEFSDQSDLKKRGWSWGYVSSVDSRTKSWA
jgi:hypothetical protein